jgi:hypothetical protein
MTPPRLRSDEKNRGVGIDMHDVVVFGHRMELLPTDSASHARLDTAPLQFALDDIESYLKREHGERRPTDDRGSRQDQKRRHPNLSNVAFAASHQQT